MARCGDGNLEEKNVKDRDSEWPLQKDFTKKSTWKLFLLAVLASPSCSADSQQQAASPQPGISIIVLEFLQHLVGGVIQSVVLNEVCHLPRDKRLLKLSEEEFESSSENVDVVHGVENSKVALVDLQAEPLNYTQVSRLAVHSVS